MIEGKDKVLSWFEATAFAYWSLFHQGKTDSGNWVAKSSESEAASNRTAYDELSRHLNLLRNGKFTLVASQKPGITAKGTYRTDIEISMSDSQQPALTPVLGGIPAGYVSKDEIAGIVETRLQEYRTQVEMENLKQRVKELEKENKELERESNDGWNKFLGAVQPYIPTLLGQHAAQVAGIPQPTTHHQPPQQQMTNEAEELQDLTPDQAERLQNAINAFAQAAPADWLEILEKMAAKVSAQPSLIQTFKAFL